ncbi:MAG: adenylosuccinate synthetase, partial [Anaerolineales bacterium]|nr:adenylosuccinate synthetase [Anaerolineales bacterium]
MKFVEKGKVSVIFDGQFGSTGKGSVAGYLAMQNENRVDIATTNSSANAGHWTKFKDGRTICTHHLPTFGVIQDCMIYLNAGSVINPDKLLREMEDCKVSYKRVKIHPRAAIIYQHHIDKEMVAHSTATAIASTRQGVGAALSEKIQRMNNIAANSVLADMGMVEDINLNVRLGLGHRVTLEIPQGYSLSLNSQFYPHVTSRNCTVMAGLADANIHPLRLGRVLMSIRTYPIRVGNIYDGERGEKSIVGYSGEVYSDQRELQWSDFPDIEPEKTTVTNRQRRIFTFSKEQFINAVVDNRPNIIFLNFVNYIKSSGETNFLVDTVINEYTAIMNGFPEMLYGHGPLTSDITENWRKD